MAQIAKQDAACSDDRGFVQRAPGKTGLWISGLLLKLWRGKVTGQVLKSKSVNFLVADAEVNYDNVDDLYSMAEAGNVDALGDVLEAFKEAYGGLWVGGKMELTQSMVRLSANAMNRLVQDGTLDIELPLAFIRKVTIEGGFMTKIIRLDTGAGSVKFRCFGAKDIAALIEKTILSTTRQA